MKLLDEKGLTLMELIIAVVLVMIISIAVFSGLQTAFTMIGSSNEYMGDVYDAQLNVENQLSYTFSHPTNSSEGTIEALFGLPDEQVENDPISFDWGQYIDGSWSSSSPLIDFDTSGVTVIIEAGAGSYISDEVKIYIPINSEEH